MEEELNNQLNVFAVNFAGAYGGFNEVKTQIGYNIEKGTQICCINLLSGYI